MTCLEQALLNSVTFGEERYIQTLAMEDPSPVALPRKGGSGTRDPGIVLHYSNSDSVSDALFIKGEIPHSPWVLLSSLMEMKTCKFPSRFKNRNLKCCVIPSTRMNE